MNEALDSVNKISEVTIVDNPSSPNKEESAGNFSLASFHEESNNCYDYEASDVNKTKHNSLSNSNQDKRNCLQMRIKDNLVTLIRIRSWIVLFVIICSVLLLFQIPIILYYTNKPPDKYFIFPELDCSQIVTLVCN